MKLPSLNEIALEQLALQLYTDNCRVQPMMDVSTDAQNDQWVPSPRWAELGTNLRQAYRDAACELIKEQ